MAGFLAALGAEFAVAMLQRFMFSLPFMLAQHGCGLPARWVVVCWLGCWELSTVARR